MMMMKMIEFLVQYELLRPRFGFEVNQMFGPSFVYRFVRSFLRRRKLVLFQSVEEHCVDFWGPLFDVLIVLLICGAYPNKLIVVLVALEAED
jgi:hypothetical protein